LFNKIEQKWKTRTNSQLELEEQAWIHLGFIHVGWVKIQKGHKGLMKITMVGLMRMRRPCVSC